LDSGKTKNEIASHEFAMTNGMMLLDDYMKSELKRATIYFDPELHRALRIKAAELDRPISEIVNKAVKTALAEDVEDLSSFEERLKEPNLIFEELVKDLKKRGKI